MNKIESPSQAADLRVTIAQASCADDYDPNSMPVAKARAFIHQFLDPITGMLRVPVRSALGRVLAEDVHSPVNVPAHRNSAMDGWAMRGADLRPDGATTLQEIGASFAGKPFPGVLGAGECTSSASTRPSAERTGTRSIPVIGSRN